MNPSRKILLFTCFTFTLLLFTGSLIHAQNLFDMPVKVRAKLINTETGRPIVFANIVNMSSKKGVISDTLGNFTMRAYLRDTLYISCLGYNSKFVEVTDSLKEQIRIPIIGLTEKIYELGDVNISVLGSYEDFKYKVLHMQLPENTTQKVNEKILKEISELPSHPVEETASIPLGSPVTAIYMLFSKEGKSIRNFQKAREEIKIQNIIDPKYNRQVIEKATGLKGEMLEKFILYCQPNREFLIKASEYEIYQMVDAYYKKFMADQIPMR